MSLRLVIDKVVSLVKREEFKLDKRIPISYLVQFFSNKFVGLVYGYIILRRRSKVFVHPSAVIRCKRKFHFSDNLSIDRLCYIDALSTNGIVLGKNVSIGKYTNIECTGNLRWLGKGLKVGNNVGIASHVFFGCAGGVEIGSDTIIGNYVSFHSENHNYSSKETIIRLQGVNHKGIIIGNDCWIGAKSTFLDGAIVGDGCIIAAGSVVRGEFPNNCIIGGIPAKVLKYR